MSTKGFGMSEQIKPCPFCGMRSAAIAQKIYQGFGQGRWVHTCRKCQARSPLAESESEAITLWESRYDLTSSENSNRRRAIERLLDSFGTASRGACVGLLTEHAVTDAKNDVINHVIGRAE